MEDHCFIILCWCLPCIIRNQPNIYICPFLLNLPPTSHIISPLGCHRAPEHHRAHSHWLSLLYTVMYMFQFYSANSSRPLLPPLPPQVCLLHLCLHCCLANGSSVPFICMYIHQYHFNAYIYIYALKSNIHFFSFFLTSLCITGPSSSAL